MHPHARRTPHAMYGSTALCPGGIFKLLKNFSLRSKGRNNGGLDLILGGDHIP